MVVPAPNESMANDTHDCAAKCNQGSGSPEDTDKYSACVQSCITSHFFSAGSAPTPAPNSPGSSGTVAGSGSATATGTAGTGKATGTPASGSATGSAAASGTAGSTGAANSMQVGTSFAGIAGIMAAIFAL
ncbi:MAG: hypothetical protein M1840_007822 [Geoglossum simile]|nr:MAG: hypothetical protein M1840_007822 [Geoglossum simile]